MTHPDMNEALGLFERSDRETDPSRKFAELEEALELVDLFIGDSSLSQTDRDLAANLRHSNIRRLLSQLGGMRGIRYEDWFNYIDLLLIRYKHEVKAVLDEESSLKEDYQAFLAIWRDKLIDELERPQKKGL